MLKPSNRRVILRAARFALASGGICLLLSLPAEQANAATGGQPSLLSGLGSDVSGVVQTLTAPVTGVLGSVASSGSEPVTGTASTAAQTPASTGQAAPTTSAGPSSQAVAPQDGQASPTDTATPSSPTATSSVTSPAGAATPKVSRATQPPAPVRRAAPKARPASNVTVQPVAAVSHAPTPVTGMAPAAGQTARVPAATAAKPTAVAVKPIPVSPTPSARPSATQSQRPIADILPPLSGMPRWLEDVLLAAGLMAATAYAAEPVAVFARRRRQRGDRSARRRK